MKLGIKGFDKDLKCRGFQFEIGGIYEIEQRPKLCKIGFHYCKSKNDVINYYQNCKGNRFCIVEILGEVDEGHNKCCTNKIKIVKELDFNSIPEKFPLIQLEKLCNKGYVIGGSFALKLYGYFFEREIDEIDLVVEANSPILTNVENDFAGYKTIRRISGSDSIVAYSDLYDDKYDILKTNELNFIDFEKDGYKLKLVKESDIWNAKLKYALQGSLKHSKDIIYNKIKFSHTVDDNNDSNDELPF